MNGISQVNTIPRGPVKRCGCSSGYTRQRTGYDPFQTVYWRVLVYFSNWYGMEFDLLSGPLYWFGSI